MAGLKYKSLEDAWAHCLGDAMPTAEEVADHPMEALKAFYFAGAWAALHIAYHRGFVDLRRDLREWTGEQENQQ